MPKLILDEHLPPALAEALGKRGIDAIAVVQSPLAALPDEEIFARAAELGRIIVTFNNPDFISELTKFSDAHPNQQIPGVVFIPGKKIRSNEVSRLAQAIEQVAERIDRGEAGTGSGLFSDEADSTGDPGKGIPREEAFARAAGDAGVDFIQEV